MATSEQKLSEEDLLKHLRKTCCDYSLTGSRAICDPPPVDTDIDYVVTTYNLIEFTRTHDFFKLNGFTIDGEDEEFVEYSEMNGQFVSYRRGHLNFVLTNSSIFYRKFVNATELAKKLNLKDKKERIKLFQSLLYDKAYNTKDDEVIF